MDWVQGEGEWDVFRPRVPQTQLNQQSGARGLQVQAVLQHGGFGGGGLGGQINGHETLKLLPQLLRHGPPGELRLTPRPLQPVQRLVHFHHLIVQPEHSKTNTKLQRTDLDS